jgi:hypothetical protein
MLFILIPFNPSASRLARLKLGDDFLTLSGNQLVISGV